MTHVKATGYLHGNDTFLVTPIESGAEGDFSFAELFLRALIEEVLLVMCFNVGVLQCLCNLVMRCLVWQAQLDFNLYQVKQQ